VQFEKKINMHFNSVHCALLFEQPSYFSCYLKTIITGTLFIMENELIFVVLST